MKKYLLLVCLPVLFVACRKETTPTTDLNDLADPGMSVIHKNGEFMNGPYGRVSGVAKIYLTGDRYQLALETFMTNNGPDLKVYLSQELQPVNFVNLGSLRSTMGNQLYEIPAGTNVEGYKYALIYCQQYSHLFGSAELGN